MRPHSKGYLISLILILTLSVSDSCTPETCLEETVSGVNAVFFRTSAAKAQAPDSVTLYGIGPATGKIYSRAVNRSVVRIPLNAGDITCAFVIKINDITDTLTFNYTSYPHLVSKECGFTYFHRLESVLNSSEAIDISLFNGTITTSNEENIRIFY